MHLCRPRYLYSHVLPDMQRDAMEAMARLFEGVTKESVGRRVRPRVLVSSTFPPSLSCGRTSFEYASERRETLSDTPRLKLWACASKPGSDQPQS